MCILFYYHRQLPEWKRHFYEVIPEGAVCKLYFDLEFDKTLNPSSNGVSMVKTFVRLIQCELLSTFNIWCKEGCILHLDASTSVKFSQHLIFDFDQCIFKDNINAGHFVINTCEKLQMFFEGDSSLETSTIAQWKTFDLTKENLKGLLVKNKDNKSVLFCDTGRKHRFFP